MAIFGAAAASGVLVKLRCPKCYEIQARARGPEGTTYECRNCHASFSAEQGRMPPEPEPPRRKKR